jgi:tetratricopeptide (TPR) repeat protein
MRFFESVTVILVILTSIHGEVAGPEQPDLGRVQNSLLELDHAIKRHAELTKELSAFSDVVQKAVEGRKVGLSEAARASHLPPAEPFFWLRRQNEILNLISQSLTSAKEVEKASVAYQQAISNYLHISYHVKSNMATGCYEDEKECTRSAAEDAGKAVLRLQDTYALTADEISRLGPRNTDFENFTLTISDCFELGRTAYNSNLWGRCIQWMNLTLDLLPTAGKTSLLQVNESEVLDFISFCYYKTEDFDNAINTAQRVIDLNPYNIRVAGNLDFYYSEVARLQEEAQEEGEEQPEAAPVEYDDYMDRYRALCRLMLEENPHNLDQLFIKEQPIDYSKILPSPLWNLVSPYDQQCVYLNPKISAWDNLRGVALEVLSINPPLVIFHDFLSPVETEEVKATAEATGRLARSTVHDPATGKLIHADYRTSEGTFIYDKHLYPNIIEVERRISLLTGLGLSKADDLQIAHYAPGGHYEPHSDMANQPSVILENEGGNRIATLLIYLNDVNAGGATAFIEATPSFVVRPKRGAALFWFNLAGPHGPQLGLADDEK